MAIALGDYSNYVGPFFTGLDQPIQEPKEGDKVRILDCKYGQLHKNKIGTVVNVNCPCRGVHAKLSREETTCCVKEYELIGKEVKQMQKLQIGDKFRVKIHAINDKCNPSCALFNHEMIKYLGKELTVKSITEDGNYHVYENEWEWSDCMMEKVISKKSMLYQITKQQEKELSKGQVALLKLGVIDSSLRLQNNQYVLDFLFAQNKKAIEDQAVLEVKELEDKEKKAKE